MPALTLTVRTEKLYLELELFKNTLYLYCYDINTPPLVKIYQV